MKKGHVRTQKVPPKGNQLISQFFIKSLNPGPRDEKNRAESTQLVSDIEVTSTQIGPEPVNGKRKNVDLDVNPPKKIILNKYQESRTVLKERAFVDIENAIKPSPEVKIIDSNKKKCDKLEEIDENMPPSISSSVNSDVKPSPKPLVKEVDSQDKNGSIDCLEDMDDFFSCSPQFKSIDYTELDLSTSKRCMIHKITKSTTEIALILHSSDETSSATCILRNFWINLKLDTGNIVHVSAIKEGNTWYVSNTGGFVVYEPDFLVSTTSVVGSLFCKRRSILSEKYKGYEPSNKQMVVGILLHSLLQQVLQNNIASPQQVKELIIKLLATRNAVWMMYESSLSKNDLLEELSSFIPNIVSFVQEYILENNTKSTKKPYGNWKGKIDKIHDIEENVWCPELGMKGKIDVSIESNSEALPIELKSGRASMSLEHRGQVLLYLMMMKTLGYNIKSGLLLYLRENVLREINFNYNEERDLILLRNELVYYLLKTPKVDLRKMKDILNQTSLKPLEIPEPINHHSACSKCPYNTICVSYLKYSHADLRNNKVLKELQETSLSHLNDLHIKYFIEWSTLLSMEDAANAKDRDVQNIYIFPPEKREKKGKCVPFLSIKNVKAIENGMFENTFTVCKQKLVNASFYVHTYVVVSTTTRPAVATGFVTYISDDSITVVLERDLTKRYGGITFHLDTFTSASIQLLNYTNLALLLDTNARAEQLRNLIIEKQPPSFQTKLPKTLASKGKAILKTLDRSQQRAILKAISANDYLLIKGMPGTGKTTTIVALVQLLLLLNKTVLITSHTHSAVDNVCLKLKSQNIDVLRLASTGKIDPNLHDSSDNIVTKHCTKPEELEEIYSKAKVIAVTCLGASHPCLNKITLDYCIVDESTQVIQCSVYRTLFASRKFILVGDPDQLSPVVRSNEARLLGLSESLFERLDGLGATEMLRYNYRMNTKITEVANALTYKGELLVANEIVGSNTLQLPYKEKLLNRYSNQQWVIKTLSSDLSHAVQILDTGCVQDVLCKSFSLELPSSEIRRCSNPCEAAIVATLVNGLLEAGVNPEAIGVITPFRAQVSLLINKLGNSNVAVNTVDQFQGKDKDVILYSCTKTSKRLDSQSEFDYEIMDDKRRLTVAVTRAKYKLIIIGDVSLISTYSPFSTLFSSLEKSHFLTLKNGELDFQWNDIMN